MQNKEMELVKGLEEKAALYLTRIFALTYALELSTMTWEDDEQFSKFYLIILKKYKEENYDRFVKIVKTLTEKNGGIPKDKSSWFSFFFKENADVELNV